MSDKSEFRQVIFQVESRGIDRLHVTAVAANEMEFEIFIGLDDFEDALEDVCKVAPIMMRVDAQKQEEADGSDVHPTRADRLVIREFLKKYRSVISDYDREMLEELC